MASHLKDKIRDMMNRAKRRGSKLYKAEDIKEGGIGRTELLSKQEGDDFPVNEADMNAGDVLDTLRQIGQFDKLDVGYNEPTSDSSKACGACMFFIRNPWRSEDGCQAVEGSITWYGTCQLFISSAQQIDAIYSVEDIGMFGDRLEKAAARALSPKTTGLTVSTKAWDGSKEVAAMDIATLRASTLAFVGDDPDSKTNYKLPYREAGGAINAAAVRAIQAALGGARGGVDLPSSIRSRVRSNADTLMTFVQSKLEKAETQIRVTMNDMEGFISGSFIAKSIGDGVTQISGTNKQGAESVYAYTLDSNWDIERAREYAQKSAVGFKSIDVEERIVKHVEIRKSNEAKRIVYGVVLEPNIPDAHGDQYAPEEIEKACHAYNAYCQVVNRQHDEIIKAEVVESYIAPTDFEGDNGVMITKGSWIQGTRLSKEMWAEVQSGAFTGYSFEGWGIRTPIQEA